MTPAWRPVCGGIMEVMHAKCVMRIHANALAIAMKCEFTRIEKSRDHRNVSITKLENLDFAKTTRANPNTQNVEISDCTHDPISTTVVAIAHIETQRYQQESQMTSNAPLDHVQNRRGPKRQFA